MSPPGLISGNSMKIINILSALGAFLLLSGSQCTIVGTSGGGSDDPEEEPSAGLIVIISDGQFIDDPVEGIQFESGSVRGVTGPNGEFRFEEGKAIRFFIGDIALGQPVPAKPLMSPLDLVPGGNLTSPEVTNIARLLQSLDAIPGDERITIPPGIIATASAAHPVIGSTLEHLDLADNEAFANSGSQLIATLTENFAFTATLVDATTARRNMLTSLEKFGLIESRNFSAPTEPSSTR
jgi:hypothetical protein